MTSYKREYELTFVPTMDDTSNVLAGIIEQSNSVVFSQTAKRVGLMIDFNITKSETKGENVGIIGITNPSKDTIASLQKDGVVTLKVGYKSDIATILVGSKDSVSYYDNGGSKRIELSVLEGKASYKQSYMSQNFPLGTTNIQIITEIANHIVSNVPSVESLNPFIIFDFKSYQFPQVVVGDAFDLLDNFLKPIGYKYFINKGVLNIVEKNTPLKDLPVILGPHNGMIGSPKPIMDSSDPTKSTSGIEVMSIINYNFDIGRLLSISSEQINGIYKISSVNFIGNSYEGDWISNIRAVEYNGF